MTLSNPNPYAGESVTVTAFLADANGNGISTNGKIISWSKSGSGGSFSSATSTTNPTGVATVTFTTGISVGIYTITATDNTAITGNAPTLTTVVGPVVASMTALAASAGSIVANGTSTSTITVQLFDANGNPQTYPAAASVQVLTSAGTISPATDNHNGSFTAILTSSTIAGTATVSARVHGGLIPRTATVTFVPGSASKLGFVAQPASALPGVAIAPGVVVAVQDQGGNTVPTATDNVTISIVTGTGASGAALGGTRTIKAVAGVANFGDLTVSVAGMGYRLTVASGALIGASSSVFNVLAFASVATGTGHSCALTSLGAAYCWGGTNYDTRPVAIPGGLTFTTLAARVDDSCAVASSGTEFCWDHGFRARPFGVAAGTVAGYSPQPSAVVGGLTLHNIVKGGEHTCGLNSGGAVYCWGSNQWGAFGTGVSSSKYGPPTTIPQAAIGGLTFTNITAGRRHTCGVAIGGTAYCWGTAQFGELGDGNVTIPRSFPAPVSGSLQFRILVSSGIHTCGVTIIGEAYCWGENHVGQVGNGLITFAVAVPTRVPIP